MKGITLVSLLVLFSSLVSQSAAQDPKAYKGKCFYLKTHENAFREAHFSKFDDRKILEANVQIAADGSTVLVNGSTEWFDSFIVSKKEFEIKDFKVDRKDEQVKVKLQATNQKVGTELKLTFNAREFNHAFYALFTDDKGMLSLYAEEARPRLFKSQIQPRFGSITEEEGLQLLDDIQAVGGALRGKIDFDIRDGAAFVRLPLFDSNTYNTARLDKNQRLAASIQEILTFARDHISTVPMSSPLLGGYIFDWNVYFRNFVTEESNSSDAAELVISRPDFQEYAGGNLSAFELVGKSLLRVNGDKYSLTSWDPVR